MLAITPESLFLDFQPAIEKYIYRRTSDPDIAKDLTSQVFHKATEALATGRGPRTSISGWLYRAAHNAVIDHYRARERRRSVCLDDCPDHPSDDDPVAAAVYAERKAHLLHAMQSLTPEQRQVIQMRYLEGYSFAEIAQAMNKTEGAVKALQHRALITLRTLVHARQD